MKIAGTGHRPDKLGGYRTPNVVSDAIGALLQQYLERERPEEVITGMALGFDQMLAWTCLEMGIPFAAYIPCDNFDSRWPEQSRETFRHLMEHAARIVRVSPGEPYHPTLMQRRNARMVDDADKVIALWNGTTGGTANCIRYANSVRKPIDYLPLPVEIWDQAREWEESRLRRNRPSAVPAFGRPLHLRRRQAPLLSEEPNDNNDVLPGLRVTITPVTPVSVPFDPNRPIIDIRGMPEDIVRQLQTELRNARNDRQRQQAMERYRRRREVLLSRIGEDTRPVEERVPRLTDEFPLPPPPPSEATPAERARVLAEQLREHIPDDVMRELVRQNRSMIPRERPQNTVHNTQQEDRFTPRRKLDIDD